MGLVLGMPISRFLVRITTEPLVVLKTVFVYWWIQYLGRNRRFDLYSPLQAEDLKKNNVYIPTIEQQVEKPQPDLQPNDRESVFLYGGNTSGDILIARVSRQRECNIPWLYLGLSDGRTYDLPCPKSYPPAGEFVAGGLRVKCILPMRKWRLSFNGLLREHRSGQNESRVVHVKFSFLCMSSSNLFDLTCDIQPKILADYIARGKSSNVWNLKSVLSYLDTHVQAVMLMGTASVDGADEVELYLWGARKRSKDTAIARCTAHLNEFFGCSKEGQLIYSGDYLLPLSTDILPFGFYLERNSLSWPVTWCRNIYQRNRPDFDGMKVRIMTVRSSVNASVEPSQNSIQFIDYDVKTKCYVTKFKFQDGDYGHGILLESDWKSCQADVFEKPSWTVQGQGITTGSGDFVLPLGNPACQNPSVSGGKGSSLSTLTHLTKKYRTVFKVPSGFVVTTEAYRDFYNQAGVKNIVSRFEKKAWSYEPDKIKDICSQLVAQMASAKLPESIKKEIQKQVKELFSENISGKRFAVRSSASGEDSEEMSAAGQMSTFLGVEGLENVYKNVVKCWSSQFSFTAIQYKRQNGQELNSPMAVVVQEMVPADTAGVLFTCDPVTGNPQNVTITANYGLGESVVSASADPDTIVFERNEKNQLSLKSVQKGKKALMIVMADEGETLEKEVDEVAAGSCCLTDKHASILAETGVKIEAAYGLPVDIEWAFKDNQLYMLQARPVTTIDLETRFEVANSMNSALRAEDEYNTKANVGEVMPGFSSHLGLSYMTIYFMKGLQETYGYRNKYAFRNIPYYPSNSVWMNHVFINLLDITLRFYKKGNQSFLASSNVVSLFGRELDEPEMFDLADRRNRMYPTTFLPLQIIRFLKDLIFGGKDLRRNFQKMFLLEPNYSHCSTSRDIYEQIWRSCLKNSAALGSHMVVSMNSAICNNVIMGLLAQDNKGWDVKVFSDFSKIMASCGNLESADIPRSIMIMSKAVLKSIDEKRFKEMTPQEILNWLETTKTPAGDAYRDFIKRHGHRCWGEFDIYRKPWRMDRLPIIQMLQDSLTSTRETEKVTPSASELLKSLQVPLSLKTRLILRLLFPLSRWSVFNREQAKSLLIKMMDFARKGFWTLSEQMVKEGRLPEQDLMFFLDHHELVELIQTRSPAIIQRAIRRKHMSKEIHDYRFPEICKGVPVPLNLKKVNEEDNFISDLELKGTPVSQGVVKAYARVATSLEEAAKIKPGEILIAYSTDIAWSPYFPLLSGVATELGGLISHGAVVAREYGLPCVVAVHGATNLFRTGDYVLLNGNTGLLKRLEQPED